MQVILAHVHKAVIAESASARAGKGVVVDFKKYHPVSRCDLAAMRSPAPHASE